MIPVGFDLVVPSHDELRARYVEYRRQQARELVGLLPDEAVRPLYRKAISASGTAAESRDDPLGVLLAYCETILPLPPFDTWVEDALAHPEAYVADLADSPSAPTAAAPATLVARRFDRSGQGWIARLRGFRDRDAWRGYIAFEADGENRVHRTSLIFREADPEDLLERFLGFESATLDAFLRSSLP